MDFDSRIDKFFCIISIFGLAISFVGFIIFIKTLFFCMRRYIRYFFGIDTEISEIVFNFNENKTPLSPNEIVEKRLLKEKINKFARDTYNIVKSNNYLTERKDDVVPDEYKKEMEQLNEIYVLLDKMPITTAEDLDEVSFLFNKGKLRSNKEIIDFYELKTSKQKAKKYKDGGFLKDITETYEESEISSKLIVGLSLMFISALYFIYKLKFAYLNWTCIDILKFIRDVFRVAFNPWYRRHSPPYIIINDDAAGFSICMVLAFIISFLIGGGSILLISWLREIELYKIYKKADTKKKPDIMLGVNTASYLYVLHKLLKKRK